MFQKYVSKGVNKLIHRNNIIITDYPCGILGLPSMFYVFQCVNDYYKIIIIIQIHVRDYYH